MGQRNLFGRVMAVGLVLVVSACSGSHPGPPEPDPQTTAEFAELVEEVWQYTLDRTPFLRQKLGLPIENLPDLSLEGAESEAAFALEVLDRLRALDPQRLGHQDSLTWSVLERQALLTAETPEHFDCFFRVTPYAWSGVGVDHVLGSASLETADEQQTYLGLLAQLEPLVEDLRGQIERQRQQGIQLPRPALDPVIALFSTKASPASTNPYLPALSRLPDDDPLATDFQEQAKKVLGKKVVPAFQRLVEDLSGDYRESAPEEVGMAQYEGCDDAYLYVIRARTGLDLKPQEIHDLGLAEVARLDEQMADIRLELGFTGTAAEFHEELRSDPRFLAQTPEEVGERLMAAVERIEPAVDKLFGRTPKAAYGVARLDPSLEASVTFGYYEWPTPSQPVGRYLFNGSQLDQRPLVGAAALIYHELVPGHHFQIALQNESEELPALRRESYDTAFVEGWAEYASNLGFELGLYEDPYDRYGRLAMDLFLSTRLVVDTGMNALGWSREDALDFMRQRLLETETQFDTETLRYAVDLPGQALAYKLGSRKIAELRERAERELGEGFDIRRFHDTILAAGALPLAILDQHVEAWIAEEQAVTVGTER